MNTTTSSSRIWMLRGLIWGFKMFLLTTWLRYQLSGNLPRYSVQTGAILWLAGGLVVGYLSRNSLFEDLFKDVAWWKAGLVMAFFFFICSTLLSVWRNAGLSAEGLGGHALIWLVFGLLWQYSARYLEPRIR